MICAEPRSKSGAIHWRTAVSPESACWCRPLCSRRCMEDGCAGWRRRRAFFSVASFDVYLKQSRRSYVAAGGRVCRRPWADVRATACTLLRAVPSCADARQMARCAHATWRLKWYDATTRPGSRLPPRTRYSRMIHRMMIAIAHPSKRVVARELDIFAIASPALPSPAAVLTCKQTKTPCSGCDNSRAAPLGPTKLKGADRRF